MRTKIFFFDLDGTLLNTEKQITPGTYAALTEWHKAGNLIAINSGRPLISILKVIEEQKLSGFNPFAIAFNGALIYSCREKKNIIKKTISLDDVENISRLASQIPLHHHSYDDTSIITPAKNEEIAYYTRVVKLPIKVQPDFPKGLTEAPCKMLCIDLSESGKLDKMIRLIKDHRAPSADIRSKGLMCDRLTVLRSNPRYLEVFSSDAGKGKAVSELAAYLGIDPGNTFAAGDEENDLSMIKAAGCGVAMCNGNPSIFEAADIITVSDNDHDGLADVIMDNI